MSNGRFAYDLACKRDRILVLFLDKQLFHRGYGDVGLPRMSRTLGPVGSLETANHPKADSNA
jgi:hypothetical protein